MFRLVFRSFLMFFSAAALVILISCGTNPGNAGGSTSGTGAGGGGASAPVHYIAVADSADNRIVIYNSPLTSNESASIVLGQTNFTQGLPNQGSIPPSANTLVQPGGLVMDSSGNMWVADTENCRVLEFQPPFTTGMNASLVIGEPDFHTTGTLLPGVYACLPEPSISSGSLETPISLAFDSKGNLWVTDIAASRITEYVPPFSNGMAASVAIGQTNLNNTGPCNGFDFNQSYPIPTPTPATLCEPSSIAFDPQGDLWVSDEGNDRLLEFAPPFSTGMSASLEMVGQPPSSFNQNGANCNDNSNNTFCLLVSIAFDRNGDLWAADTPFGRVMEFVPPFNNSMSASLVIQQHNYTPTDDGGSPGGLSFDSNGNLIVSDTVIPGTYGTTPSGRISVYAPPFSSSSAPTVTLNGQECPDSGYTITANTLCGPAGMVAFR